MATKWLEQFVKYQGLSGDFWAFVDKEGIDRQELERQLQQCGLDTFSKRTRFFWNLQAVVEQVILEHPNEQNSDVADLVVKHWNEQFQPDIDKNSVLAMLDHLPIRHDMMRRAFRALCSGHFPSYELYTQGDPGLFVQLFVRAALPFAEQPMDVFVLAEAVLPSLFSGIQVKREMTKALRLLMMTRRDSDSPDYKTMIQYRQAFPQADFVFAKGMLDIIVSVLEETEKKGVITAFLHNVQQAKRVDSNSKTFATNGKEQLEQEKVLETEEPEMDALSSNYEIIKQLTEDIETFSARIREHVHALEQNLDRTETADRNDEEVVRLREENERLYMELEQMKQQQAELEWKRFKQFVQAVGGNQYHYLLSELYEESQKTDPLDSEMTRGRLVNLLNALSLFGLEPTAYGYNIGQQLTLTRQELRERFMMLHPIHSSTNEVHVKVIRHGWMFYGQVIVQPLVEEVKESVSSGLER